jgi:hypothetical protein
VEGLEVEEEREGRDCTVLLRALIIFPLSVDAGVD